MSDNPNTSLSISIVCYNSPIQELQITLRSLISALAKLKLAGQVASSTIFLVDNSNEHRLELSAFAEFDEELSAIGSELRLIKGQGNIGYGSAHNLVIHATEADYHLLLNPDVELVEDCLQQGVAYLEDNRQVAVVSPHATTGDGHKQHLCKRYPSVLTFAVRGFFPAWLKRLFYKRLARFEMHDLDEAHPCDGITIVSGCFMLCRCDSLKQVGGFDENYFMYFEDFDLSLRIGKNGRLAYLPAMKIKHHGGHSAGKGVRHIGMFVKSGFRFFNTYGWRFIR